MASKVMSFLKTRAARKTVSFETADRLARAQNLRKDDNLVSAETLYRQTLELDPHNWDSLNGLEVRDDD